MKLEGRHVDEIFVTGATILTIILGKSVLPGGRLNIEMLSYVPV